MLSNYVRKLIGNSAGLSPRIFMYLATHQDEAITYQTTLARTLKINYTTLNHHITKFKQEGLVNKQLKLTSKGNKLFKFLWDHQDSELLRAHNIQIVFYLASCPVDYVKKYSNAIFTLFGNKKFKGLKGEINLEFGKATVMVYSRRKIVCVLKDIFGKSDEEVSSAVQEIAQTLQDEIEKRFEGIKIDRFEPARIQTSHIAYLDSILAQKFELEGFTYEGKNIAVDKSHGKPELELTNPKNNLGGIEIIKEIEKRLGDLRTFKKYTKINKKQANKI